MELPSALTMANRSHQKRLAFVITCSFPTRSSILSSPFCRIPHFSKSSHTFLRTFPQQVTTARIPLRCAITSDTDTSSTRDVPFEIRGFSLANVGLLIGFIITGISFYSYFSSSGTASGTSLGFVYGVPILLIGCALKYAELKPIPLSTTKEARLLREKKGTKVLKKVVKDITRHRYGDEAHLSAAMRSLGLSPRGKACPELVQASEDVVDGEYALTLRFVSTETPWKIWEEKKGRYERFFGPGVRAEVSKLDAEKRLVELKLITV